MKRFWTEAGVVPAADGFAVRLDGRPIHTPRRGVLVVPGRELADAIAAEWQAIAPDREVGPRDLPMTGLANAAIDLVAPDRAAFAAGLAAYARSDLTCYRAEAPEALVGRQADAWDPPLAHAQARHGLVFHRTAGVAPIEQPALTLKKVEALFGALDPFRLAALQPIVSIAGSAVLALALMDGLLDARACLEAATVDERWQAERWGEDEIAKEQMDGRERDFLLAAEFLRSLG